MTEEKEDDTDTDAVKIPNTSADSSSASGYFPAATENCEAGGEGDPIDPRGVAIGWWTFTLFLVLGVGSGWVLDNAIYIQVSQNPTLSARLPFSKPQLFFRSLSFPAC
jgi:hypothetical protein